jgi:hypothetical protein
LTAFSAAPNGEPYIPSDYRVEACRTGSLQQRKANANAISIFLKSGFQNSLPHLGITVKIALSFEV